jgi:hypothetical protein
MELQELAKQSLLKNGEAFVAGVLADVYDPAVAELSAKLKALIPGELDDSIISMIMAVVQPELKKILLAKVANIHQP